MRLSQIIMENVQIGRAKANEEKYVFWNESEQAYQVMFTTGQLKVPRARIFSVSQFGSKDDAFKAAVEWRDDVAATLGLQVTPTHVKSMYMSKPADMVGLSLKSSMQQGRKYYYWSATLGATAKKDFPIIKYGYEGAYKLAREAREAHTGLKYREVPPSFEEALQMKELSKTKQFTEPVPVPAAEGHKSLLATIPGIYLALRSGLPADKLESYDWVVSLDATPVRGSRKKSIGIRKNGYTDGYKMAVAIRNELTDFEYPEDPPSWEDLVALRPKVPEKRPNYKR